MNSKSILNYGRSHLNTIQNSSLRILPYWISAATTALFAVIFARVFAWSESLAYAWFDSNSLWIFILLPTAVLTSAGLAHWISPRAAGSGIPQVLAALEVSHTRNPVLESLLSFRMIIVKFFGTCISVAGGGITGREGPMLQISAGIFYLVHRLWSKIDPRSNPPNLNSMILAGGAAGLASAFNTPLGGIIFAIEELAKVHISQIRTYVFHAVIISGLLAQAILGNYLYLGKLQVAVPQIYETLVLVFACALIGFLGALFGTAAVYFYDFRSQLNVKSKFLMTFFLGLIVATGVYFFGRNGIGSGREVIVHLLTESTPTASFSLAMMRGLGNLLTYAGGVVGGVFAPALSSGAALGSWLSSFFPAANHQVWILAGMIAFLTGLTRTPFTSLILVLEMTDSHNVIISLLLAGIVAQSAARLVDSVSFYEHVAYRIIHGRPPDKNSAHAV